MRILMATDTYYPHVNGASYFAQRLAYHLNQRGHTLLIIAPGRKIVNEKYQHQGIDIFGVRSLPVFIRNKLRFSPPFSIDQDVLDEIESFNPDVVHIQDHAFVGDTILRWAKKAKIPTLGTNHFMPENILHYVPFSGVFDDELRMILWKHFTMIYKKIDIVTTPTKAAAQVAKANGFPKEMIPVSCGIDLTVFNPDKKALYIYRRYNITENVPYFLYVGRLDKEKNIDVLIRAFSRALEKVDSRFVIVGMGNEETYLKELVDELGIEDKVIFTGFVTDKDLPALYASAWCFMIAGQAELQSIATMQALASGLPVIGLDAVALPELIHHGDNGFLFFLNNPDVVSDYIIQLVSNPALRQKMSTASLKIIKKHDIEETTSEYERLYKTLLERKF